MGDLGATLIKELNCETAFTIGGIGISESVVVTWIMMAVVLVVSLIVTHGLKVEHPGRGQLLLENAVTWLQGIGEGILGEEGKGYAPYLTSGFPFYLFFSVPSRLLLLKHSDQFFL